MIFKGELAEKVMAGEKTVTRRLVNTVNPRSHWWKDRCLYRPGQIATVNPGRGVPNIGRIRILSVEQGVLGWLTDAEARAEGFADAETFERGFSAINGGYDPDLRVYVLRFEVFYDCETCEDAGIVREEAQPTGVPAQDAPCPDCAVAA